MKTAVPVAWVTSRYLKPSDSAMAGTSKYDTPLATDGTVDAAAWVCFTQIVGVACAA